MTMMIDEQMARMRTHRNNIYRYRHLLQTKLTELERDFIEKRLAEEQLNLERWPSRAQLSRCRTPQHPRRNCTS